MPWQNLLLITGQTHEKLTSVSFFLQWQRGRRDKIKSKREKILWKQANERANSFAVIEKNCVATVVDFAPFKRNCSVVSFFFQLLEISVCSWCFVFQFNGAILLKLLIPTEDVKNNYDYEEMRWVQTDGHVTVAIKFLLLCRPSHKLNISWQSLGLAKVPSLIVVFSPGGYSLTLRVGVCLWATKTLNL